MSFLTKQEMWKEKKGGGGRGSWATINNDATSPKEASKKGFSQVLIQRKKNTTGFSAVKKFLQPVRSLYMIRGIALCYFKFGKNRYTETFNPC